MSTLSPTVKTTTLASPASAPAAGTATNVLASTSSSSRKYQQQQQPSYPHVSPLFFTLLSSIKMILIWSVHVVVGAMG